MCKRESRPGKTALGFPRAQPGRLWGPGPQAAVLCVFRARALSARTRRVNTSSLGHLAVNVSSSCTQVCVHVHGTAPCPCFSRFDLQELYNFVCSRKICEPLASFPDSSALRSASLCAERGRAPRGLPLGSLRPCFTLRTRDDVKTTPKRSCFGGSHRG